MRNLSSTLLVLVTTLTSLVLAAVAQGATVEENKVIAELRAQVAALQGQIVSKDAKIHELETDLHTVQSAVAFSSSEVESNKGKPSAASSTLDWTNAMKVATAARFMVPGSNLISVMPTGSMKPVFDEKALLLTEPAKYDDLKVGDIVTYRHPRFGMPVVHRILEKRGDKFWAKGDNNSRMDEVYITRENYMGRVFGVIYSSEPSAQAKQYAVTHGTR